MSRRVLRLLSSKLERLKRCGERLMSLWYGYSGTCSRISTCLYVDLGLSRSRIMQATQDLALLRSLGKIKPSLSEGHRTRRLISSFSHWDHSGDGILEQFKVNFFGAINITNAFLPSMRARRDGTIVMLGSRSGWRTLSVGVKAIHQ